LKYVCCKSKLISLDNRFGDVKSFAALPAGRKYF